MSSNSLMLELKKLDIDYDTVKKEIIKLSNILNAMEIKHENINGELKKRMGIL